jgi:hypothetical protein
VKFLARDHTKASCVWLRRCRFCSRKSRFFRELTRNSICLISIMLDCLRRGDVDCRSETILRAWSKCSSTASDSRSIKERKTLAAFIRCTIEGRSRSSEPTGLAASGSCLVSRSTFLISVVQCSSSTRVEFVSKSMTRTGRSIGCIVNGADSVRKRLKRGIDSRSTSEMQWRKAHVIFFSESQKAARPQKGQ